MKGKRFREEQIIAILKEADAGLAVAELIRKSAISEQMLNLESEIGGVLLDRRCYPERPGVCFDPLQHLVRDEQRRHRTNDAGRGGHDLRRIAGNSGQP